MCNFTQHLVPFYWSSSLWFCCVLRVTKSPVTVVWIFEALKSDELWWWCLKVDVIKFVYSVLHTLTVCHSASSFHSVYCYKNVAELCFYGSHEIGVMWMPLLLVLGVPRREFCCEKSCLQGSSLCFASSAHNMATVEYGVDLFRQICYCGFLLCVVNASVCHNVLRLLWRSNNMTVYVCVPVTERVESSEKLVAYFTWRSA